MKLLRFSSAALIFLSVGFAGFAQAQPAPAPVAPAVASAAPGGPEMVFPTNNYDFGRVTMGYQVNHTFIVSNAGTQTLTISEVRPGCHCTTAKDWTHQIAPGKTGEISIKFDSGGINGDVTRSITVRSNGKTAPVQTLLIHGNVWREIEVTPQTAYMMVMPESTNTASTIVHIVNQGATPIELSEPTCSVPTFKGRIKVLVPGKEFELTVSTMPMMPSGNNVGTISIKTTSTNSPVLNITALAMVQPSLTIAPLQIVLPPDIHAWTTNEVFITANSSRPLVLSDLQVCCDKSIKATLKEVVPARQFNLLVAFPPGFKLAPGQRAQVFVKSNNAEHPMITIPITQFPRQPAMAQPLVRPRVLSQAPSAPVLARP
jgi:hypothetical protein